MAPTETRRFIFSASHAKFAKPSEFLHTNKPLEDALGLRSLNYVLDTPLSRYTHDGGIASGPNRKANERRMNFEKYLESKCQDAVAKGGRLKLLDVGIGTGVQWVEFLARHPEIDFFGTACSRGELQEGIRTRVVSCAARDLHDHFSPGFFDLVVTHYGMNCELYEGFENAHHLLRVGGEAVLSGWNYNLPDLADPRYRREFELLAYEPTLNWFIHFRKEGLFSNFRMISSHNFEEFSA